MVMKMIGEDDLWVIDDWCSIFKSRAHGLLPLIIINKLRLCVHLCFF